MRTASKVRLKLLDLMLRPACLWGLDVLMLCKSHRIRLTTLQATMGCLLAWCGKRPSENSIEYFRRRRRVCKARLLAAGVADWGERLQFQQAAWAHQVAAAPLDGMASLATRAGSLS
eukprot:11673444-Prorocentrum_lima.AAC.1